jgi:uncharacterized protein involved in oxidation of intracellular sulfur
MKKILLIINGPAYGADETFNAIRLAGALGRREDVTVRVFLMGDAVTCAIAGQKTPNGYYTLDRMLKTFTRQGGQLACCGTCLDADWARNTSSTRHPVPPWTNWQPGPSRQTRSWCSDPLEAPSRTSTVGGGGRPLPARQVRHFGRSDARDRAHERPSRWLARTDRGAHRLA